VMQRDLQKLGPLKADDPSCGKGCPACGGPMKVGDSYALVVLGPGGDPVQRELAREEFPFKAVAVVVHWECATGEEV